MLNPFELIPSEILSAARTRRAIMLRGLPVFLRDTGRVSDATTVETLYSFLTGDTLGAMVDAAGPAVWLNVQRIYAKGAAKSTDTDLHIQYFLAASFDSFWQLLPPGATLTIRGDGCDPLCLPGLGVRILASAVKLRRRNDDCALEELGAFVALDESKYCRPLRRRGLALSPAILMGEIDPGLLDAYSFGVAQGYEPNLDSFATQLAEATRLITRVAPGLAAAIARGVRWYVPIPSADADTHRSHTSPCLPGAIFLSQSDNPLVLAEAIVHEYGHNLLNAAEVARPLRTGADEPIYYSPWRSDSRPMRGLIHALFVFSGVSEFLRHAEQVPTNNPDQKGWIRERRQVIAHRLILGANQLDRGRLTPFCLDLMDRVCDFSTWLVQDLQLNPDDPPDAVVEHVALWTREHPTLSVRK